MKRNRYGDRDACAHCGQDIEFVGRPQRWWDRGGGTRCLPYEDRKSGEIVRPRTRHAPEHEVRRRTARGQR